MEARNRPIIIERKLTKPYRAANTRATLASMIIMGLNIDPRRSCKSVLTGTGAFLSLGAYGRRDRQG